jgi:UDP-hydrolysing UDP-N-acetyl-D-glucosamine 2-epimerase
VRKICIVIGSRANYSSIKSTMIAVKEHLHLELQIVAIASAVLSRYGSVVDLIESDGFIVNRRLNTILEGESLVTMAKSTGLGLLELPGIFNELKPDIVLTVGDRFETMSTTLAASYMNIPLAHTMGGEVTGTIDESIRHAVTKFAQIHFPANEDSRERVIKMGEDAEFVFNVGCPRTDLVFNELKNDSYKSLKDLFETYSGVGKKIDITQPYLLVSQHPVTTEFGDNRNQIEETLKALQELNMPTILLWPNADAGSDDISKGIRTFRENKNPEWLCLFKNLPIHIYIHLMNTTACLIGNSSSGIREGAFIGTPVVNIGTRQNKRLRYENVEQTGYESREILNGIKKQLKHGKYHSSNIYGDGTAGVRMAEILSTVKPKIQKVITY